MRSPRSTKKHTAAERQRVLAAFRAQRSDWLTVAEHNGVSRPTAYRWAKEDRDQELPRGGAREVSIKVTPDIKAALERYLDENCQYTLSYLKSMIFADFRVELSTSTISRHLLGMTYTVKQTRIEPNTCNNDKNKKKRVEFAEKLLAHQEAGNCIVYYDETNFNVYCKRERSRAKRGERAITVLPLSQGANLQIQCAVNATMGLVLHRLQRGSIQMDSNAEFVEEIYQAVKASPTYRMNYSGKKIVIVFDNAPCHCQTETRVLEHHDMELLRLAPYSPMCNPIEGCFSVLKSHIKNHLALERSAVNFRPSGKDANGNRLTIAGHQMDLLERAANDCISCITPQLVVSMELHCRDAVNAAKESENMQYGK